MGAESEVNAYQIQQATYNIARETRSKYSENIEFDHAKLPPS